MACPICSKPADKTFAPFCSRRCADVDLSRWLKGSYAIPGSGQGRRTKRALTAQNRHENNPLRRDAKSMDTE